MPAMSELTPSTATPTADPLVLGRAALARHAWEEAFDGEILVTAETLAEASDVSTSGARSAAVKGVTAPVDIAEVAWA